MGRAKTQSNKTGAPDSYTDQQRASISQLAYNDRPHGQAVHVSDTDPTVIGYAVGDVHTADGMHALIVTDEPAGTPPDKVTHVTIVYQGTDWHDLADDGSDLVAGLQILAGPGAVQQVFGGVAPPQFHSAEDVLKDNLGKYKNATVDVYGHSLGSMDGQYAMASLTDEQAKRTSAYLYEGPNIYNILTPWQKGQAAKCKKSGRVHQYIDVKDVIGDIGIVTSLFGGRVGDLNLLGTKNANGFFNQHMLQGYEYKDGTLVSANGGMQAQTTDRDLRDLDKDAQRLAKANGGKLSKDQKIWLDEEDARAIVTGIDALIEEEIANFDPLIKASKHEADTEWSDTLADARAVGTDLSEDEIRDALEAGGATAKTISGDEKDHYDHVSKQFHGDCDDFTNLSKRIDKAIDSLLDSDKQLAGQIDGLGKHKQ